MERIRGKMKLGCSVLDRLESACLMWAGQVRRMREEQPAQKAEEEKDSKTGCGRLRICCKDSIKRKLESKGWKEQ